MARQRYLRCDPNNRLVASTLEADWNTALRALEQVQTEGEQQRQQAALVLTDEVRARVMALTTDFPAVWRAPQTTDRDRKRMLRLLLEDVTLLKTPQQMTLQVRFRGGSTKTLTLLAPQASWQSWTTPPERLLLRLISCWRTTRKAKSPKPSLAFRQRRTFQYHHRDNAPGDG